jgi:hypothetical protein
MFSDIGLDGEIVSAPDESVKQFGRQRSAWNINDERRVKGGGIRIEPVVDITIFTVPRRAGYNHEEKATEKE